MVLDATSAYVVAVIFLATLIRSTLGFGEAMGRAMVELIGTKGKASR